MAAARIARRRRNPIANQDHLPYDEWIPSHAVKFNSDGTVDLMTEGPGQAHNPTIGSYQSGLKAAAPQIAELIENYWGDAVAARLVAMERKYGERLNSEVFDELYDYGMREVEKVAGILRNAGMVQNIQGYKDAAGHFHPIRWDSDYDPEELEDPEPHDYVISPSRKFYQMSGETPPRSRKRKRRTRGGGYMGA